MRRALPFLVAFATGCAGGGELRKDPTPLGSGDETAQKEAISRRDLRAFEDGVEALEAQKEAGVTDLEAMEKQWKRVTSMAPEVGEGWYNLGVALERQGKSEEAARAYRSALERKSSLRQAALNLAVLFQNQGKVRQAVEIYHQVLRYYPDDSEARSRLADLYRSQGDLDRAASFAREALIREAQTALAYKVLMRVEFERGNPSLARLLALKALKLGGDDAEVHFLLAQIALRRKQEEAAIASLKTAIGLQGDHAEARLLLVDIAIRHDDWFTVEAQYRKLIEQNPKDSSLHLNLGVALRGQGRSDEAEQAYAQALALDPRNKEALFNGAIIAQRVNENPELAIERAQKFISLSNGLAADHLAYQLVKEAEKSIELREEAKRMEEEMLRQEAEMVREEEALRKEEEKRKREEDAEKQKALDAEVEAAKEGEGATPSAQGDPDDPSPTGAEGPASPDSEPEDSMPTEEGGTPDPS